GRIQPVVLVKISPEVSGEIIDLPVKEGQDVKKGDLLLKIKPDFYLANRNSAEANLKAVLANRELAQANCQKAELEFKRMDDLFKAQLISESQHQESRTALEVAQAQVKAATHQSDVARASLARAEEEHSKTTIYSPLSGTISKLNSQVGERVVGTATMAGTEVMTIANLDEMEARVEIGEIDVVLIKVGQEAELEVDSFRDKKFKGTVSEIANTARTQGMGTQQEATKFEVKIRISEKESFRPGMSVTAGIRTRSRTNVVTVPIQSVTTRLPKADTNAVAMASANSDKTSGGGNGDSASHAKKKKEKEEANKPVEVVFIKDGDTVKMVRVKRGISDDDYVEIEEGLQEGLEVISGGYKAINRELEDGKKIVIGTPAAESTDRK
ncbi:MAG: efflux RND transporter periplasmic adaptor subunit, partial [Verrucomicrobiota bacterium]